MSGRAQSTAIAPAQRIATVAGRRSPARIASDIALFFAAPLVTLACLSLFPFIAVVLLAQARRQRKHAG